ncbi:glycosyltransferase family 2 protein [Vibrio mediterranei]|jgi:glycosyltransferase involved in cell wall biosynthesis|uniref:Glycosyltransferase n=3 Tax=Vibrio TaxID=662 RepID=A0ABX5DCD2_9VIBR|nr:glycosyltransferase family 2 protein [Vibrio mediterranei]MCG9657451.1 glycosyltransferase family 2 protein [Vibrio mediterranei]PCD87736.1 glycosyltransferase [Vibrio mediterranei]PRQ67360.1 glycosyltransferase [Vibrio mediterranei]
MQENQPVISIICPCYNEQEVLDIFMQRITPVLEQTGYSYEVILINDGSRDNTLQVMSALREQNQYVRTVNLSRNFGKEAALTAGLDLARGEVVIPIDADLQDPPELILDFISEWQKGFDVVVAKRVDRSTDTWAKKLTAELFYKFHNAVAQVEIPENVGDFRLINRRVVQAIQLLPENQRFMKGIFSWVGFKTSVVEYKRDAREAGETSFNGWKLWNFALDGITSFSTAPLRIWLYIGSFISALAFLYGSFTVVKTLIYGIDAPGYASLITVMLFLGGVQLIGIGVMGEYIGRLYMESKRRPTYIIESDEYQGKTKANSAPQPVQTQGNEE